MASIYINSELAGRHQQLQQQLHGAGHHVSTTYAGNLVDIALFTIDELDAQHSQQSESTIRQSISDNIQIITLIDSSADESTIRYAIHNGAHDFLPEALLSQLLLKKIDAHLRLRDLMSSTRDNIAGLDIQHNVDASMSSQLLCPTVSIRLHLGADELRNTSPIDTMLNLIMQVSGRHQYQSRLFTILSELYNNALEHGVLKLESSMKASADTFAKYYEARQARLLNLAQASVQIDTQVEQRLDATFITLEISDSGDGFDILETAAQDNYHGKGITLIRELCESVKYSNGGRTVNIVFICDE